MLWITLLSVVVTSLVSGIFGMAGGLILMGIYGVLFPVGLAMILHGLTQLVSNGSRAWLLRKSIYWKVAFPYTGGLLLSLGLFASFSLVPNKAVVFILLGFFPIFGLCIPQNLMLDIKRPAIAFVCGLFITATQLLAGASGPLLDLFFVKSSFTRHQMVGTKAVTQALGHVSKLVYYGILVDSAKAWSELEQPALLLLIPLAAILGTRLGKIVLDRMEENKFKRYARGIVLALGIVFLVRGVLYALH